MADYRLWCMGESGNAYKAALMLELCRLPWEPVWVDFFHGEARTPDYRAQFNEMGEVPVLEHDGKRLSQSGVILDYLADVTGKFGATNDDERREIWRWILFDNHKFTANLATLRYLIQFAKTGETPAIAMGAAPKAESYLLAWDPVTAKEVWRIPNKVSGATGVMVTDGNVLFSGNHNGEFVAYNATTGAWSVFTPLAALAATVLAWAAILLK